MPNFCLIPHAVTLFKEKLIDGTINPGKLADMTSAERRELFSGIVGSDSAKEVNALFESKLLLKNQQRGMITWAKTVSGIKPEVRRDIISRIQKLDKVLDPADQDKFLHDLASSKLGVDVTQAEAKQIADLARQIDVAKEAMQNGGDRLEYGRAQIALSNYVNELKSEASKTSLSENIKHPIQGVSKAAGIAKAVKASLDNSAIFRQGWKTLWTHNSQWRQNALKSFSDITGSLQGKEVLDEVHADVVSRPNYDKMKKAGLAVNTLEEDFPTRLPEKVPGFGKLYKASEAAYTGFLHRQRADIFDKYLELADRQGVNINNKEQLQSIGKLVNSLTGRGHLGGLEKSAGTFNNVFFSPRFLKSNIDTLTAHQLQKGVTPFVRKQAATNLVKIISGTAAVLGVAEAARPGSVELDPRSTDFGKIKVGNTRFDVSGGMTPILTLAARLLSQSTKSSTGVVTQLGKGYGAPAGTDVVVNFLENKLSPAASVVKDLLNQKDFQGNKPTLLGELANLTVPLPITTGIELKNTPNSAPLLLGLIADGLGIATNTYGPTQTNWNSNPTKELSQLKQKIGETKFNQANKEYNQEYAQWLNDVSTNSDFKKMSSDEKRATITKHKAEIKNNIFKDYNFKPTKLGKKLQQLSN